MTKGDLFQSNKTGKVITVWHVVPAGAKGYDHKPSGCVAYHSFKNGKRFGAMMSLDTAKFEASYQQFRG